MATKKKNEIKSTAPAQAAPERFVIDDGSVKRPILNQYGDQIGEFYFSPADIGLLERFKAMQDEAEGILNPFEGIGEASDAEAITDAMTAAKAQLFSVVDRALGYEGAAARMFGRMHPFTPVGGRFYFEKVLALVGEQINAAFDEQAAAFAEHVAKYTSKVK